MGMSASNFKGKRRYLVKGVLQRRTTYPGREPHIQGGDERTFRINISAAALEGEDWMIYRKSEFIFGDAAQISINNYSSGKNNGFIP